MNDLDWVAIRRIFEAARDLDPPQQQAYLSATCAHDEALRSEVEKLLQADFLAGDFIERPAFAQGATAASSLPDLLGRTVGPYEIQSKIGAGGMGAVYLAERVDKVFKKKVAVKILPPGTGAKEVQRFFQERQILAELEHPNIARILDGGSIDGLPYVIMEYVPGVTLRTMLNSRGALPLLEIVAVTQQICAGLHFAHSRGIIHRDIKPENVMVYEAAGFLQVKLLDFGIAKLKEAEDFAYKTSTGMIFGTPKYMSPEQIQAAHGNHLDARSDIYSLGMLVYEMLTGQVAFDEPTWMQIAYAQVNSIPPVPSSVRPDLNIPTAVERVVLKALDKDSNKRPQNALEFTKELQIAAQSEPHPAVPSALSNQSPPLLNETVAYEATTVPRQPQIIPISAVAMRPMEAVRRPRKYKIAILAFLLTALAGSGVIYYKFNPTLISEVQGNTTKIAKELAATAISAKKTPPSPDSIDTLNYQVQVTKKTGETFLLSTNNQVYSGSKVRFKTLTRFDGTVYLFYEEGQSLYWINPVNNQAQELGDNTAIPAEKPIPLGTAVKKPTTIRFLMVFVPRENNWSLEKVLAPEKLTVVPGDKIYISRAKISKESKDRLLDDLTRNAVSVSFSTIEQDQARISQIPLREPNRVVYQWVDFLQLP
jgi:serine/threonine protein kinase